MVSLFVGLCLIQNDYTFQGMYILIMRSYNFFSTFGSAHIKPFLKRARPLFSSFTRLLLIQNGYTFQGMYILIVRFYNFFSTFGSAHIKPFLSARALCFHHLQGYSHSKQL